MPQTPEDPTRPGDSSGSEIPPLPGETQTLPVDVIPAASHPAGALPAGALPAEALPAEALPAPAAGDAFENTASAVSAVSAVSEDTAPAVSETDASSPPAGDAAPPADSSASLPGINPVSPPFALFFAVLAWALTGFADALLLFATALLLARQATPHFRLVVLYVLSLAAGYFLSPYLLAKYIQYTAATYGTAMWTGSDALNYVRAALGIFGAAWSVLLWFVCKRIVKKLGNGLYPAEFVCFAMLFAGALR